MKDTVGDSSFQLNLERHQIRFNIVLIELLHTFRIKACQLEDGEILTNLDKQIHAIDERDERLHLQTISNLEQKFREIKNEQDERRWRIVKPTSTGCCFL